MKEKYYLFIFSDGVMYDMTCAVSFKDAVWEMSKYYKKFDENCSELFLKALKGFEENDTDGIIQLFNKFCISHIIAVYDVNSCVLKW